MLRPACKANVQRLAKYQDLLYASHTYALLLILQAMDAAGKDSTIKHVMSGINPEGCDVFSFKTAIRVRTEPRLYVAQLSRVAANAARSASSIVPLTKRCW